MNKQQEKRLAEMLLAKDKVDAARNNIEQIRELYIAALIQLDDASQLVENLIIYESIKPARKDG